MDGPGGPTLQPFSGALTADPADTGFGGRLPIPTGSMRLAAVAAALVFSAAPRLAAGEELLPKPPSLEPAVRFWTRVYTEVDTSQGLLHDAENLDVVYEVID